MEWINILKCIFTGNDLRELTLAEIEKMNELLAQGKIWQVDGKQIDYKLEKGLTTVDGSYIYPIIKGVVVLLSDLALVDSFDKVQGELLSDDKKLVKNFYDDRGWHQEEGQEYEDAIIFEDLRPMSVEYIKNCHARVNRYLNKKGKYMLDGGSGALQFTDYLQYSENYEYRICADLSIQGLLECKKKLGDKAICLLCDITNLPIKENMVDGFISLNTIYHIPKEEQIKAMSELYRVLITNGKGVIVYDWYKHSPWMNISLLPFRALEYFKHRILNLFASASGKAAPAKMLYFHAHNYDHFKNNMPMPFTLAVWRSISVPFMRFYIHPWLFGKQLLKAIWNYEEKNPSYTGLNGEYPMFLFEKK
jgi:ubiquinone/menaquinone biosynthesis C-methylase UbiE